MDIGYFCVLVATNVASKEILLDTTGIEHKKGVTFSSLKLVKLGAILASTCRVDNFT
jgi:hypothetical protein